MNKKLSIINIITVSIVFVLLLIPILIFPNLIFSKTAIISIVVFVLLVLSIIEYKKGKLINDKYQTIFLITNLLTILIFLREKFDPNIIVNSYNGTIMAASELTYGIFFDYNIGILTIMYMSVLIYNLLNKKN